MVKPETASSWLQKMVRAESALLTTAEVMLDGKFQRIEVPVGHCGCVTCGIILPWSAPSFRGRQMQGGHWIPKSVGREWLMLHQSNVHPQCSVCNRPDVSAGGWGNRETYSTFMLHRYGMDYMRQLEEGKSRTLSKDEVDALSDEYRLRYRKAKKELDKYA